MNTDSPPLIECVLNLSEGRDFKKIQQISSIVDDIEGCRLLHRDIGWDANRTVLTIVGGVKPVLDAVERIIKYSLSHFDLRNHEGIHPCVGIMDVIPFVALKGIEPKELRVVVSRYCKYIAATYHISIVAYGDLSSNPSLMTLAYIRKGGILNLEKRIKSGDIRIDYGPNKVHETQGVSCITVRPIMIAYNINFQTRDMAISKKIAKDLRELRNDDLRIKDVRFLAWNMEEYGNCQVSMNIYDIHAISMVELMEIVNEVADTYSIKLNGSEMIGMAPKFALSHNKYTLEESVRILGLEAIAPFIPEQRILDIALGEVVLQ